MQLNSEFWFFDDISELFAMTPTNLYTVDGPHWEDSFGGSCKFLSSIIWRVGYTHGVIWIPCHSSDVIDLICSRKWSKQHCLKNLIWILLYIFNNVPSNWKIDWKLSFLFICLKSPISIGNCDKILKRFPKSNSQLFYNPPKKSNFKLKTIKILREDSFVTRTFFLDISTPYGTRWYFSIFFKFFFSVLLRVFRIFKGLGVQNF